VHDRDIILGAILSLIEATTERNESSFCCFWNLSFVLWNLSFALWNLNLWCKQNRILQHLHATSAEIFRI
jgi:hypothetical protein